MKTKIICVQIMRLTENEDLPLPEYKSEGAAAMDIHAAVKGDLIIEPGKVAMVPCGFALAIPNGFEVQIRPRSGLALKQGVTVLNTPGTIDSDFRGEVKVILINHGSKTFRVVRTMRIAQMLILPVPRIEWQEVDELSSTTRGEQGYGHTGQ